MIPGTELAVAHTLHPYEVSADAPNYGALVAAIGAEPERGIFSAAAGAPLLAEGCAIAAYRLWGR
jgi:hypothetical protein